MNTDDNTLEVKSNKLVFGIKESIGLTYQIPIPKNIGKGPSYQRQNYIIRELNALSGIHLIKNGAMGMIYDDYEICAIDEKNGFILVTANKLPYIQTNHIQELCNYVYACHRDWLVLIWIGETEKVYPLLHTKELKNYE